MRVVIATFEASGRAEAYATALSDDLGAAAHVSRDARIGAQGEPHDGHRLVVAWVPRHRADEARERAERLGGVLHEPPAHVVPPGGLTLPAVSPRPAAGG